jgi:rod shape-determining protein MreB
MDAAIQAYVRREYGVAIGERTAEEIKLAIGSAFSNGDQYKAEVRGRDLTTGTAKVIVLSPEEVREAVDEPVRAILEIIVRALGQTPPELAQDLILQGVHLVGGGAMLRGMDQRISKESALPVHLVDAPLECVVHGAGRCLESFDRLKEMFMDRPRS